MKTAGLDIGTTGICGIRLNTENGQVEDSVTVCENVWLQSSNTFEKAQSPDKILSIVKRILARIITPDTAALGITGQMHGIVYLDAFGNAVSPLYTWQDERGNELYSGSTTYAEHLRSHSGYGNVTHFYNEINGIVPENAVRFCTIQDYIASALTGGKSPLIHISDAASFGNFDIKNGKFNIKNNFLPEFTENAEIIGKYNGIPVSVAIGDNQAGFIGSGCDEGSVLFNVGTGSQISFSASRDTSPLNGIEIRPLTNGKYIAVGCSLCGGRAFALTEKFFSSVCAMAGINAGRLYDAMETAAEAKGQTDLIFNTLFCGTRDNPQKRGEITNLTESNFTPADFVLACINGITNELFEMYARYGKTALRLIGSGNAVRKTRILRKSAEEKFGCKMLMPAYSEEAACGAALFAYSAFNDEDVFTTAKRTVKYDDLQ